MQRPWPPRARNRTTEVTARSIRTQRSMAFTNVAACSLALVLACKSEPKPPQRAADFSLPDVVLKDQDNRQVRFKDHFGAREPLVITFIYATCTTVCPVVSTGFATLQAGLGADSARIRLVSISIDPEHDTPAVMKSYLQHFRSGPGWEFLTGSQADIRQIRNAFDLNVPGSGPSMPLSFLRSPRDGKWTRLSGSRSPREFVDECRKDGIL